MTNEPVQAIDPVERLRVARENEAKAIAGYGELVEGFNSAHRMEFDALQAAHAERAAADAALRDAALMGYELTGSTKPYPGVEIKMVERMDYPPEAALAWAKNSGQCLTLDKKAFEKVAKAKALTALSFVRFEEKPAVYIASELPKAKE